MECEVCGAIAHSPKRVKIDGIEVLACEECAKLGALIESPAAGQEKKQFYSPQVPQAYQVHGNYVPHKIGLQPSPRFDEIVLVDKFGMKIQQARQRLGWTREELAKKLYEKDSTLHRIELSELRPEGTLLSKIEKILGIALREREE